VIAVSFGLSRWLAARTSALCIEAFADLVLVVDFMVLVILIVEAHMLSIKIELATSDLLVE